jgi:hypothetical protein
VLLFGGGAVVVWQDVEELFVHVHLSRGAFGKQCAEENIRTSQTECNMKLEEIT